MNSFLRSDHRHMSPYEGDAVLFKASRGESTSLHPDAHEAWSRLFPNGLETREVSGDHETFMHEPHVEQLAAELDACLRERGVEGRREPDAARTGAEALRRRA
jgi:thioesterase domain-containing protein